MIETLGVAGCGRMGLPMAKAMSRGGFKVFGFDIRPAEQFDVFANNMIADAKRFAEKCEIVFVVVRDIAQTEQLLFEGQALFVGPHNINTLVICSTLSPKYVKSLAGRLPKDVALIDAPMSGAVTSAEQANLSFMLGGEESDLDRLQPVLDTMGSKFHRMGPLGAGMTAKVLNNFVAASSVTAVRQVLDWAQELEVDADRLLTLMHDSSGQTWFGSKFEDIEFSRDGYSTENTVGILKKDVESTLDAVGAQCDEGLQKEILNHLANLKPIP